MQLKIGYKCMHCKKILNKIEQGKFSKEDLSKMAHAIATAINGQNHDK